MDDVRDFFSRQGRKVKNRLRGRKHKLDRTGANAAGEGANSSGSLLRPESRLVVGSHDGEGSRISTDGSQARSRDRSQPRSMQPGGSDEVQKRREADVDEEEVGQSHSRTDPEVKVTVSSGLSREAEQVYPSPPTLSIPPTGELGST